MTETAVQILIDGLIRCCEILAGGFIIVQFIKAIFSSS